jgi:DNA-binding XRE family transcriptional regulator
LCSLTLDVTTRCLCQNKPNGEMESTMATVLAKSSQDSPRSRVQDVDRHVGARMRARRIMLGLTQQQLADLIGVTYQQAHKYEKGINRMAAGRLYKVARVLGVDAGYFFEGLQGAGPLRATPEQRLLSELAKELHHLTS